MNRLLVFVLLLILAATGYYAWSQRSARLEAEKAHAEAEETLGLDAARVLSAHFERASSLKVYALSGKILVRSEDQGFLHSEQKTKLPATVDYFVDLSKLQPASYRYSPDTLALTIDIPDVTMSSPNIDESRAEVEQKGVFITRRAALNLARKASKYAAAKASEEAGKPANLDSARASARRAIRSMAEGPLIAAGLDHVKVAVSFPWEPKSVASTPDDHWDVSRRAEDVLSERARRRTTPATTPSS